MEFIELVKNNKASRVKRLLELNPRAVNKQDKTGMSRLHWAAHFDRRTITQLLLAHRANIDLQNEKGKSPLVTAVEQGSIRVTQLLLAYGATVNLSDKDGVSPLIAAVKSNDLELVTLLLTSGATVNLSNNVRMNPTPVIGPSFLCKNIKKEILKLLLIYGADVNSQNKIGESPLFAAVMDGGSDRVQLLLAYEARTDLKNKTGETVLTLAALFGNRDVIATLQTHLEVLSSVKQQQVEEQQKQKQQQLHKELGLDNKLYEHYKTVIVNLDKMKIEKIESEIKTAKKNKQTHIIMEKRNELKSINSDRNIQSLPPVALVRLMEQLIHSLDVRYGVLVDAERYGEAVGCTKTQFTVESFLKTLKSDIAKKLIADEVSIEEEEEQVVEVLNQESCPIATVVSPVVAIAIASPDSCSNSKDSSMGSAPTPLFHPRIAEAWSLLTSPSKVLPDREVSLKSLLDDLGVDEAKYLPYCGRSKLTEMSNHLKIAAKIAFQQAMYI